MAMTAFVFMRNNMQCMQNNVRTTNDIGVLKPNFTAVQNSQANIPLGRYYKITFHWHFEHCFASSTTGKAQCQWLEIFSHIT